MSLLPDPLHPAIVHFPIVLILLGAVAAVTALVWRKAGVVRLAAVLLAAGALAAWAAVETGESDGGLLDTGTAAVETLVDAHQVWAERTLVAAGVAALLAVAAAVAWRWPRISRGMAAITAASALTASWMVFETGHRGGQMVYRHGAGVLLAPTASGGDGAGTAARTGRSRPDHDND